MNLPAKDGPRIASIGRVQFRLASCEHVFVWARWNIETKRRVADLLDCGLNHTQIAQRLGHHASTPSPTTRARSAAGRPALHAPVRLAGDPALTTTRAIRVTECQERFGFARQTWNAARRRGAVVARPTAIPIEQLLVVKDEAGGRWNIKRRLLAAG